MPYDVDELCDVCGKRGAFDFMGDLYCGDCADKYLDMEDEDDQDA